MVAGEAVSRNADALAVEAVASTGRRVVRDKALGTRPERGVVSTEPSDHRQQRRGGSATEPRHRPCGVLALGDRDDAAATNEADGRLDPNDAANRGRAEDRAVGLRCDRDRRRPAATSNRRSGRRPARRPLESEGVVGLAAHRAPPRGRFLRTEVRPLRKVRLPENDHAGGAQRCHHVGVAEGRARQRERPTLAPRPAVSRLSLTTIGMPCRDAARARPTGARDHAPEPTRSASGAIARMECNAGPVRRIASMRAISAWVSSALVVSPASSSASALRDPRRRTLRFSCGNHSCRLIRLFTGRESCRSVSVSDRFILNGLERSVFCR